MRSLCVWRVATARFELRGALSVPGLLREMWKCFERIPDSVRGHKRGLPDNLMSALAVFGLKFPSLLRFDRGARTNALVRGKLRNLYGVEDAPCDTALRSAFKRVFAVLQRSKGLEGFSWLGHYVRG